MRLIGIQWGLPNEGRHWSFHPDEPVNVLFSKQIDVGSFDFDPGFYNYGTLYLTMLSIAGDVAQAYSPHDMNTPDGMWKHFADVHMAGRLLSALAGAGTALLIFLMARRRFGPFPAALGALVVAVAPGFVVHSRFQTVDAVATFFIAASVYWALKLLEEGLSERDILKAGILAGLFAGLSAGTKYNGILVLAVLAVVLVLVRPSKAARCGLAAAGISIATFLLTTPGVFLNPSKFWTDFMYEVQHTSTGHGLVFEGMPSGFVVQLFNLMIGVGPLLVLAGITGLIWGAVRKERALIAVGVFTLLFYILLGRAEVLFLRYTFPLYVGLALGFAWLMQQAQSLTKGRHVANVAAILCVCGFPLGGGLMTASTMSGWMAQADPREKVAEFFREIAKNKPDVTVGVVADPWFYSPPFYPDATAPRFVPPDARRAALEGSAGPRVVQHWPTFETRFDWDAGLLTESRPDYVVYSSFEASDLERLQNLTGLKPEVQVQVDRYRAFQERLKQDYEPMVVLPGSGTNVHDLDYIRPTMWVWKRKATP